MNGSMPMTKPDKLNKETPSESMKIETDELGAVMAMESDGMESEEGSGIIEIPSMKMDEQDESMKKAPVSSTNQIPTLAAAYRCVVGAVRKRNEDSCLVFSSGAGGHFTLLPFGLYIVADGMGGHANGHVASKTASRLAARYIVDKIYLPLLHDDMGLNQTPIQEVLVNATQSANTAIYKEDLESDSGTTLTTGLILGRRLHVAHVGDSRLYLFSEGKLEPVTSDHSLVQRLQDVGQPADDVTFAQIRHVLLRAVGQIEDVEVDTYMRLLPKRGKLLVCTDGLCGPVSDAEIQQIMAQDVSIEQIADDLTAAAMDAGGYDNITAIVVEFSF